MAMILNSGSLITDIISDVSYKYTFKVVVRMFYDQKFK